MGERPLICKKKDRFQHQLEQIGQTSTVSGALDFLNLCLVPPCTLFCKFCFTKTSFLAFFFLHLSQIPNAEESPAPEITHGLAPPTCLVPDSLPSGFFSFMTHQPRHGFGFTPTHHPPGGLGGGCLGGGPTLQGDIFGISEESRWIHSSTAGVQASWNPDCRARATSPPPQVRCSGCPSSVPGQQPLAIQGDGWRLAGAAVAGMPWPPPGTAAAGGRPGGNSVSTTPRRLPAAPPTQLVGAGLGCVPLHLQSIV